MKSAALLLLASFFFALTGGAGFSLVHTLRMGMPESQAPADTLAAAGVDGHEEVDSATAEPADSLSGPMPGPDPVPQPEPKPMDAESTQVAGNEAADSQKVEDPEAAEPESALPPDRLATLFGKMRPREAARVMQEMSNQEIQMILALLNDRQASGILGSLPPERAAAVSKLVIRTDEKVTP